MSEENLLLTLRAGKITRLWSQREKMASRMIGVGLICGKGINSCANFNVISSKGGNAML